jgi:hypothetical protein
MTPQELEIILLQAVSKVMLDQQVIKILQEVEMYQIKDHKTGYMKNRIKDQ